jgi:ectoine hydroxylase
MAPFTLERKHREAFDQRGFCVVPRLFSVEEIESLRAVTELMMADDSYRLDRHDSAGLVTKLSLRNALGDDAYSATVRCERVARSVEALLGSEVYHYHHKVMIKEPAVGGAWEWHQDYGYWYQNGCLRPDMASCMIALTSANESNGCLEVIPGSHAFGRVDHLEVNDQVCADPARVDAALSRYPSELCAVEAGDAVFFHCNLLHRSLSNRSSEPRLSLINCYNTKENDPIIKHHHPSYSPLSISADAEVLLAARRDLARLRGGHSS